MSLYWRKYTIDIPSNGAHHGGEKRGNFSVIGFQKALDTLEWRFIKKILELCNFGENVKKWVRIVYANIESAVMIMVLPPSGLNQQGGSGKAVRFLRISSYLGPKYYRTNFVRQQKSKGLIYLETIMTSHE